MRAYDPAFAYELAILVEHGIDEMYVTNGGKDVMYYITLYNENYVMPPIPSGVDLEALRGEIIQGMYRYTAPRLDSRDKAATILFSGTAWQAAQSAAKVLEDRYGIAVDTWSVTSYKSLREEALEVERSNRLQPTETPKVPYVTSALSGSGPIVAVSDFMKLVPDQIARFVSRPFTSLGTDGYGRSDTRESLRRFYEVDEGHIVVAVLTALAGSAVVDLGEVEAAIIEYGLNKDRHDPTVH